MKLSIKGLLFFLLTTALLSSCKKDSSPENSSTDASYYVKFKVKGNWVTLNKVFARVVSGWGSPAQSGFELLSQSDAGSERLNIGITVDGSSFSPSTYSPDNSFMSLSYTKNASTSDFETYMGGGYLGGGDTRYEITITSITDKVVEGSFSGSYLRNASNDNDLMEITEGKFTAQRIP